MISISGIACSAFLLAVSAAPADSLSVDIEPQSCIATNSVRDALRSVFASSAVQPSGALNLRFSTPSTLALQLLDSTGAPIASRTIAFRPQDCHLIPRTIALIVAAWTAPHTRPPLPHPTASHSSDSTQGTSISSRGSAQEALLAPPPPPLVSPRAASGSSQAEAPTGPGDVSPELAGEQPSESESPSASNQRLAAAIGFGPFFPGAGEAAGLIGQASVEWQFLEHWALGVSAEIRTTASLQLGPIQLDVTGQSAHVLAGLRVPTSSSSHFAVRLGPGVHRQEVDLESAASTVLYDAALALSVAWAYRFQSGLALGLSINGTARLHREHIVVHGLGEPWQSSISPFQLFALVSAGWGTQ